MRARIDRVLDWVERADVDVLALQETKAATTSSPSSRFDDLGYEVAHGGITQWNGVAVLSRVGLTDVEVGFAGHARLGRPDCAAEARALGATCGGVRVWSLYVPNGRTLDDPHYVYKLDWLDRLREAAHGWLAEDPRRRSRWSATGTSPRATRTSGTSPSYANRHARHPARAGGVRGVRRRRLRRRRPPVHAGPGRLHLLGLHAAAVRAQAPGMRIDFVARLPGARRPGDRRLDRPRGAQGQGRLRPRTGASSSSPSFAW